MEKTFEVELTITQRFNTRVKVSGDFADNHFRKWEEKNQTF
ncbi:hypothetical protein [Bacillus glycinifermentans]|nr:hypothetical protein [Bacillus glycinifermentans]